MSELNKKMIMSYNKTLRLDNVLIKPIFSMLADESGESEDFEIVMTQMENQLKSKGASPIGPLIQYSGIEYGDDEPDIMVSLMMQADKYINNPDPGFRMEPVIRATNCMYVRFEGREEDLPIAYQKVQVEAYENDISLKGDNYTVFVDGDDEGNIVADIFMEREET